MTELSPREKALVEATNGVLKFWLEYFGDDRNVVYENLHQALRAYDPPKPKIPVLPPWEGLSIKQQDAICGGRHVSGHSVYDLIRTLTSKEQE